MSIACKTCSPRDGNYTLIYPKEIKRSKTNRATQSALSALKDFYKLKLINANEYASLKNSISISKTDDEVSLIMSKVRRKVYN